MIVPTKDLGTWRKRIDLVLIAGEDTIGVAPTEVFAELHLLDTNTPSPIRLHDRAAERLGDELMAEADAHKGDPGRRRHPERNRSRSLIHGSSSLTE